MPNKKNHPDKNAQALHIEIKESDELLTFLLKVLDDRSRNSVKSILARGQVSVNGHTETQYNYQLKPGQKVAILTNKEAKKQELLVDIEVLYEDEDIIVINKEAGLLSIATETVKENTALHHLMNYVKKEDPRDHVFVVHRLDKETSGVMLFAKSEPIKQHLQNNWNNVVKERIYVALVEGKVTKKEGVITSWLKETKTYRMYSSHTPNDGLFAETHYRFIKGNADYSLLEISIKTGRKNQIRVHMQDIGHPIVGDKKYGSKNRKAIGRLGLHAHILTLIHPTTQEKMTFKADVPASLLQKLN